MAPPLTPKPTRKAETLVKAPPTIVSRRKEDATLKEVAKPRLCCANDIFETKTKDGNTGAKAPTPRTNPNTKEAPTAPNLHSKISGFFFFLSPCPHGASELRFEQGKVTMR
jgi:hypothetical protein